MLSQWEVSRAVVGPIAGVGGKLLMHGAPGTGKTTQACKWAAEQAGSYYRINLHEEKPAADLLGFYQPFPTEHGTKFEFVHGPMARAWMEGKPCIIDEIDKAGGDVLDILLPFLDDQGVASMLLPNGETITPKDGFFVIATMNGEPEDLPAPLRDRFHVRIKIDKPHPDAIAALPNDVRKAAENTTMDDEERSVSVRQWNAFALLRDKVGQETAAQAVFAHRATEVLDALRYVAAEMQEDEVDDEDEDEENYDEPDEELCECEECVAARV